VLEDPLVGELVGNSSQLRVSGGEEFSELLVCSYEVGAAVTCDAAA